LRSIQVSFNSRVKVALNYTYINPGFQIIFIGLLGSTTAIPKEPLHSTNGGEFFLDNFHKCKVLPG
jgi:hypothetical protein